ncbi:uncharacterized protein [Musca autumnalis]|uniref:uncharacterized protein n=1 Tax=Musca autumnalis TaxID=221902 RepID=UPI003CEAA27F
MSKDSTPPINMNLQHQQEDFAKKKQEREQEIQAIQEMLNNITKSKSPQEIKMDATVVQNKETENKTNEKKENATTTLRRSSTDLQLQRAATTTTTTKTNIQKSVASGGRQSRIDSVRSQTSGGGNKPRSKSLQLPPGGNNKNNNSQMSSTNKKTYNPEEARRFMEMQKKKRRSEAALQPEVKANKEKEEIKKRLEELKKNTKKLVSKNLDKKKQQPTTNRSNPVVEKNEMRSSLKQEKVKEISSIKGLSLELQKPKGYQSDRSSKETKKQSEPDNTEAKSLTTPGFTKPCFPLAENYKRIGLLRKTEDEKDYSFSALKSINNDKENRGLEELTSKLSCHIENNMPKDIAVKKDEMKQKSQEQDMDNVTALEVPKKTLQTTPMKSVTNDGEDLTKKGETVAKSQDLPFLLRPTTAQVYPYNFIMAVRRKLEAISQSTPAVPEKREKVLKYSQATSTGDLLPEYRESDKKRKLFDNEEENESKKRKSLEGKEAVLTTKATNPLEVGTKTVLTMSLESLKSPQPQTYTMDTEKVATSLNKSFHSSQEKSMDAELELSRKTKSKYKSMESIVSNYSTTSLPLAISNTLTEVSSLRTESRHTFGLSRANSKQSHLNTEDEVTSISSQIFSSPEKKYSKQYQNDFEFAKPRPVSPLSLEKVENLKIKSKTTNKEAHLTSGLEEDRELHFSQLLDDFNRSLSQVIQVNEQLKSTLDKSSRILSPRSHVSSKSSNKESTERQQQYSSDFENSPSTPGKEKLKLSLENTNEKLKSRKRQLFEMANKVKPLLTSPPKDSLESEDISNSPDAPLPQLDLNMKLDLKNISSNRTTTTDNQGDEEDESTLQEGGHGGFHQEVEENQSESEEYGKRLSMIENLKENLKQTIKESQNNRRTHNVEDSTTSARSKKSNMSVYTSEDGRETLEEVKEKSTTKESERFDKDNQLKKNHTEIHLEDCRDKEDLILKYTKSLQEENSNEETIILYKRNKFVNPKATTAKRASETESYDSSTSQSNVEEKTSSKYSHHSKSLSQQITQNHSMDSKMETYSITSKSEVMTGRNSQKLDEKNQKQIITNSSISEDLQQIQELSNKDNENAPPAPPLKTKNKSKSHSDHATNFINCHINRSRGDFQELNSKEATLNETQFHLAIRSSQTSCTDLTQSADDEVTTSTTTAPSSIKSIMKKQSNNYSSNPPSYSAVAATKQKSPKEPNPTCITLLSPSKSSRRISIGTEIIKFFHQYDHERSDAGMQQLNDTMSESSLNYSNVGLYDKLIQNEMNKTQYLTALLKMREKALMDRTKGQIAWLEVQKARYKAKGLLGNIAAIKKKQRGILLKMEKEREEIKRLLQSTSNNNAKSSIASAAAANGVEGGVSPNKYKKDKSPSRAQLPPKVPLVSPITKRSSGKSLKSPLAPGAASVATIKTSCHNSTSLPHTTPPILKATYELESSTALEELLKKREEVLKKRRQHVEHLMKWHQRLDEEEAEVLQLERQLLSYNNVQQQPQQQQHLVHLEQKPQLGGGKNVPKKSLAQQMPPLEASSVIDEEEELTPVVNIAKETEKKRASRARKMEKLLKDIDKSLKELSHISATNTTNNTVTATTTASNCSSAFVMGHNNDDLEISSNSQQELDFVRTTGSKLNKLWRRLTSQTVEKFEPTRRYKLCKADLERLYEEAKMAVLRDFAADEERIAQELLEKSSMTTSTTTTANSTAIDSPTTYPHNAIHSAHGGNKINFVDVPVLNLNFSSGHSEAEEDSINNTKLPIMVAPPPQGNYSPSVAEENFKAQLLNSSASSTTSSSSRDGGKEQQIQEQQKNHSAEELQMQQQQQQKRIENNVQMFLALTKRLNLLGSGSSQLNRSQQQQSAGGLQRSLSDTEISEIPKFSAAATTTTSHRNVSAKNASQDNTTTTTASTPTTNNKGHQMLSVAHQKSKSCIAEITNYIPYEKQQLTTTSTATHATATPSTNKEIIVSRPTVIATVGKVPPLNAATASPQRRCFSGQVDYDTADAKAKEISSKLDEISAAVNQLSQANALPSYPAAIHSKSISTATPQPEVENSSISEETNLSATETSSYSLNFANISIDRHSSPGSSQHHQSPNTTRSKTPISPTAQNTFTSSLQNSQTNTFVVSPNGSAATSSSTSKTFTKDTSSSSRTFTKDQTPPPPHLSKTVTVVSPCNLDKSSNDEYEPDFEPDSTDETHIEDISLPLYETTVSENTTTTIEGDSELNETSKGGNETLSNKTYCADTTNNVITTSQPHQSVIKTPPTITITTSPDKELLPPPPPPPSLPPPPPPPAAAVATNAAAVSSITLASPTVPQVNGTSNSHLMPDIINELDLRRHPLIIDNEHLKQYEHVAVPYMYVREIPNKPPPPYVPPAHGSPMTTIFPSEERIRDITFRRTHELYCELLKTEYCNEKGEKLPSVIEEQITNIYERIILDICREYLEEHSEILREGDPTNFHSQLAFFNPPNRLRCIQDAIYKEVRHCLAMDKTPPKRTQIYSVYGQRAKQDHIGKIIIQEMYDEDDRWCNFHREESEVLILIVEEMINKQIRDIAKEVMLEEGIPLDEDVDADGDGVEIEEIENTSEIQENLENTREEEQRVNQTTTTITSSNEENTKDLNQTEHIKNTKSNGSIESPSSSSPPNQQNLGNGVLNENINSTFNVTSSA